MAHSRKVKLCRCGHAFGFHYYRTIDGKRKAACNHGDCRCKEYTPIKPEERSTEAAPQETSS